MRGWYDYTGGKESFKIVQNRGKAQIYIAEPQISLQTLLAAFGAQ